MAQIYGGAENPEEQAMREMQYLNTFEEEDFSDNRFDLLTDVSASNSILDLAIKRTGFRDKLKDPLNEMKFRKGMYEYANTLSGVESNYADENFLIGPDTKTGRAKGIYQFKDNELRTAKQRVRRMYEQGGKKDQYPSWADENKGVTDARDLDEDQQRALFFANTFMQRIDKTPGKADNLIYDVAMNRRDKSKFTELYGGTHYKDPSGVIPDSTRNKINDVFSNIE